MTHLLKKTWVKYLAQAIAVAVVIAGAVFYVAGQKSVVISVDGEQEEVSTRAATVSELLNQQEITLAERDEISAAPESGLSDNQQIDIKRNKSVEVTIDGTERVVHTTGMTVADVVNQLNLDKGSEVSLDEDMQLTAVSDELEVITPKDVKLIVNDKKKTVASTASTIKELLAEQKIKVDDNDEINVKVDDKKDKNVKASVAIEAGAEVEVIDVSVKTWDETRDIDFDTKEVKDDSLEKGETEVETTGEKGERELTLRQETRNGKKGEEEVLKSKVSKEPVVEVVSVGTKDSAKEAQEAKEKADKEAEAKAEEEESSAKKSEAKEEKSSNSSEEKEESAPKPSTNTSNISSTWKALAKCESGGNWAINSGNGYYGGLQFSASSWRAVGGTKYAPLPHQASPQEQIAAAEKLRASGGWGHWPACSSKLGLR